MGETSVGGTAPLPPASLVQPGGKARILFKVKLIASNGKLFQSWVTVQMKNFYIGLCEQKEF